MTAKPPSPTALDDLLARAFKLDVAAARALLESAPAELRASSLFHQARGVLALKAGDVDAAVAAFEEACAGEPDVGEHRASLGAALLEKARTDRSLLPRARAELERAWAMHHVSPDVGTSFAFALEASGEHARALAVIDEVLARFPDHVPALFNKASALKALGRIDDARAVLDHLLRAAPGFAPAVAARARL